MHRPISPRPAQTPSAWARNSRQTPSALSYYRRSLRKIWDPRSRRLRGAAYVGHHAWFVCLSLLLPALAFAQPSNDSLFAQLKQQARTELADSVWEKATFGHEVSYLKAGEAWARTVALTATWGQAALDLSRTDTLSRAQVRAVRRASSPPFRGDAPGAWQKTLLPAFGLVAGTAVVVVLFYLRSR